MFHTKRMKNEMEISILIFALIKYKNYKINKLFYVIKVNTEKQLLGF